MPERAAAGPDQLVDVVVVGGGPAGLAAASWLARYRRSVLVVDSGEHRSDRVEASHGYLGRDPQRPRDLLAAGREEVLAYPTARIVAACVAAVERRDAVAGEPAFVVLLDGGRRVLAHRVVLACGVGDVLPTVAGIAEHYGASAFHCPACDGYEARDQDVVVIGWGDQLTGFAAQLLGWARSVTIVTAGHRFVPGNGAARDARRSDAVRALRGLGVEVVEDDVTELVGRRGALESVRLASGRTLGCALVFFSVAHVPRTELAVGLGCALDDDGYVAVNDCHETTVRGVYAAGDLVPGLQLVAVAAATGVVAGVACAQSLFGERTAAPSPEPAPEVPLAD